MIFENFGNIIIYIIINKYILNIHGLGRPNWLGQAQECWIGPILA